MNDDDDAPVKLPELFCAALAALVTNPDPEFCAALAALVTNPDRFVAGEQFWVVLSDGHGAFQAAWIDEDGELKTAVRKYRKAAITLASESWGR